MFSWSKLKLKEKLDMREFKLRRPKNRASDGPDKIQLRPYMYFKTYALLDLEVLLNKRHTPHQSQIVPAASPIRCLL